LTPHVDISLQTWIEQLLGQAGYLGLAGLMVLENLVPPVPSELILPVAGFFVGLGRLEFLGVLIASTVGSLGGALLLYGLGRKIGEARLRRLLRAWGGRVGFATSTYDRGAALLRSHATPVLFWGRFVPGLRSILSLPAGIVRIPLPSFLLWTGLSALCWNSVLIRAGWWLGAHWDQVALGVNRYGLALVGFAIAAGVVTAFRNRPPLRTVLRRPRDIPLPG
jgi:membrane protein DedA with SNARE-associated domain